MMNALELPKDILSDKQNIKSDIVFYHYSSNKDSIKRRSILNRNVFSLVVSGRKTLHLPEKTLTVQSNEIHLLSAGNCISSMTIADGNPFECVLIFFDNNVLRDFYSNYSRLITKVRKMKPQNHIGLPGNLYVAHFAQSFLLSFQNKKQPSEEMKRLKLQELFLYLLENHAERFLSFELSPTVTDMEIKLRKVVEANKEHNLTVSELAFLCNVSIATFKRHFRKIYDCSPAEWINNQRMVLAGKMLARQKPSEIWHKLGFETHTGFTRSFKKHYGILPKDYVRKMSLQE